MEENDAFEEEQRHLTCTETEIDRQLNEIGPRYFGHDYTEQVLDAMRGENIQHLQALAGAPYFGRLDFQENGSSAAKKLYIGKYGLEGKETSEPWIIDWRAPVASLFYSFTGGDQPVTYEAPEETFEGIIHLKRNLAIRQHTLQRVVDSYVRGGENVSVNDEFLLYRLGENKDNRLRDIVSTIQSEQDQIIRAPKQKVLIIQGVAGSGKTTVALHRLAFLLYQYKAQLRAERMIIFAPNTMFLDYISEVLPELGVGGIQQTTFADWALNQLSDNVKLRNDEAQLVYHFALERNMSSIGNQEPGRYKGSLEFKSWIDRCLDAYEKHSVPDHLLSLTEMKNLQADTVGSWYFKDYSHYPLVIRRERTIGRIKRWVEMELAHLSDDKRGKEQRKSAKQRLNAYIRKWVEPTPLSLYKSFFEVPAYAKFMTGELREELPKTIMNWTRKRIGEGIIDTEDLAALIHIRIRLLGVAGKSFDHIVIDEAQDISPFQIALLNEHMREPSFTILGDLAQAIHEYKGIHDWNEMMHLFKSEQTSYHQLVQSYRSTMEIIEFANGILAHANGNVPYARPVFRSGDPVKVEKLKDRTEIRDYARQFIKNHQQAASIAILGRTAQECSELHRWLTGDGLEVTLVDSTQSAYRGGISILPVYLSKGLEFDAVLLIDLDQKHYPLAPLYAKLLYVGCTRALHNLSLIYCGIPSPLLSP